MTIRPRKRDGKTMRLEQQEMWMRCRMFCNWGHHWVWRHEEMNEKFDNGVLCLECQIKIGYNLTAGIDFPELGVALASHQRQLRAKKKVEAATVAKIRRDNTEQGFVYYIRINGRIKIGYASNVTARTRHYPPGSELLAVEPGTFNTEAERHQDFHRDLVEGREWFAESEALKTHMARIVAERGDPSVLAYKFTEPKSA